MNEITLKCTTAQVAVLLDLLRPYAELSISLSQQYKAQAQGSMEVSAQFQGRIVKATKITEEKVNG